MKNLSVTDEELGMLIDAVCLLRSACVYADNRNNLYTKLVRLEGKLQKCYDSKVIC